MHRDFKPSNLLVDENNRIKICDFGLSQVKPKGENLRDREGEGAKGTPLWMAPEVLMGLPFNEKADVYRSFFFLYFSCYFYFLFNFFNFFIYKFFFVYIIFIYIILLFFNSIFNKRFHSKENFYSLSF